MTLRQNFRAIVILLSLGLMIYACGAEQSEGSSDSDQKEEQQNNSIAEGKGIGEITNVTLNSPLDEVLIEKGKDIYQLKCAACHKLDDKRVVGPGFKGVTDKRKPEWIMNMITNVDVMLAEDPEARKLLQECMTRMPNQGVSIDDARAILEFMYSNDQPS